MQPEYLSSSNSYSSKQTNNIDQQGGAGFPSLTHPPSSYSSHLRGNYPQMDITMASKDRLNQGLDNVHHKTCELGLEAPIKANNSNSKLRVNSDLSALGIVLNWFESLKKPFISRRVWIECQTVLGEAFDNAVIHAHQGLSSETAIEIEVKILSQLIIIKVWDQGPGFDLRSQRLKVSQGVDDYAEHGRGVQIFEKVADYFNYGAEQDGRNCLLIIKFFDHQISRM
ncbi:MAG: anti-sigma regulatory factor [Xenococcus sp. MO_188.B8]|nr:anti-sigma regulatory factor [Xenococcus sp. MO_188.B8]